jgi:ribonuclease BN (tRNA processing enzyme)
VTEFVVLGSAGWLPQAARMTTCMALSMEESLFLLDAGTGLSRLAFEPFRRLVPPRDRPVHIFLTHFHLDHVVGLSYLPALWSNPTVIHLPPAEVTGVGPKVFDRLFGGPFNSKPIGDILADISLVMAPLGPAQVEGRTVETRRQDHPGGSVGLRIDDWLAFITDCRPSDASMRLAEGVRILVNEAWTSGKDDPGGVRAARDGHSSAAKAAQTAKDAGTGELLLSHLPPAEEEHLQSILDEARGIFPNTSLCADGLSRTLG